MFTDKLCLVTGASSGIGYAVAKELARLGLTLVLVSRDPERGMRALDRIRSETGNPNVDLMLTDLASQGAIRLLARQFQARYDRLDTIIHCAGIYRTRRHTTIDGVESTLAVNVLAPFLLTNLLLDSLAAAGQARIVMVSGESHRRGELNFADMQLRENYRGRAANARSQLGRILITRELARRLKGHGITANCFHPGGVGTNLPLADPDYPFVLRLLYRLAKPLMRNVEHGAETALYLALAPEIERISGDYFIDMEHVPTSKAARDPDVAKQLWETCARLTRLRPQEETLLSKANRERRKRVSTVQV